MRKAMNYFMTVVFAMGLLSSAAMAADLEGDKRLLQRARQAAQNYRFDRSERFLNLVLSDVRTLDPSVEKRTMKRSLRDALMTLRDQYAYDFEKIDQVDRTVRVCLNNINQLQRGRGGEGPVHGARFALGETDRISQNRQAHKTIQVAPGQGRFRGIELVARKSAIDVYRVEVTFGNGRVQVVNGRRLGDGQSFSFRLRGNQGRNVKQVLVVATSRGWSKGKIRVLGIR